MKTIIDPSQKLTEHFTLGEFLRSEKAQKLELPNVPLKCHITSMQNLCVHSLEPIRQHLGLPLLITSGYRCEALNRAVGGVSHSQHLYGEAADITIPKARRPFGHPTDEQTARLIYSYAQQYAEFDQLILEHRGNTWWVHISCRIDLRRNRHQSIKS